ncbi:MAG TPA: hypothetical protein EYP98_00190 [Planctomycetes bacterium]|nr:hypothetical protein [Planctomycetota bacterium]
MLFAKCTSGFHRADTYGRTTTDMLNAIVFSGRRKFNAMHFPLVGARHREELEYYKKNVSEWGSQPWTVVATKQPEMRYAYNETLSDPRTRRHFALIWYFIEAWNERNTEMLEADVRGLVRVGDGEAHEAALKSAVTKAEREEAVADTSSGAAVAYEPSRAPRVGQQGTEMIVRGGAEVRGAAAKKRKMEEHVSSGSGAQQHRPMTPTPPPHAPPERMQAAGASGSNPRAAPTDADEDEDEAEAKAVQDDGWKSLTFDIDNWYDVLDSFGVDDTSQKELALLSQLSWEGAEESNQIISKLLKKHADGEEVRNPSAFVHRAVQNARNGLHRKETWH